MASNRAPYHESKRKLVISIDLGTTYSGVSYCILDPGKVPEISTVNIFPGHVTTDAKIPTIIWYDRSGNVLAVGAEGPPEQQVDQGDLEGDWLELDNCIEVEWFKMLLAPKAMTDTNDVPKTVLPPGKTDVVDIIADFYSYMFAQTQIFIKRSHASNGNGNLIWESVKDDIEFILAHPNGWAGSQQSKLRAASVKAGLVSDTAEGRKRIHFVTEGEASLHYCINSGLVSDVIMRGERVMVIDAGGGTVDVSTYMIADVAPLSIKEIAAPGCIYQGSIFVRQRARRFFERKLENSRFGAPSYIDTITAEFDRSTKKRWRGTGDPFIKFSHLQGDSDPQVGVRKGNLRVSATAVASFFEPSIRAIVSLAQDQQHDAGSTVKNLFLVGGFGVSEYLFTELEEAFKGYDMNLFRPDRHTSKAVAEGAISYHIDHFVSTRVARHTYGTPFCPRYIPGRQDHEQRAFKRFTDADGELLIPGGFSTILPKDTQVAETTEFKSAYCCVSKAPYQRPHFTNTIWCYKGEHVPDWMDMAPGKFSELCTVSANLSRVPSCPLSGPFGTYYRFSYAIVLSFGLTELKAHLTWTENGMTHTGPASIVYDDDDAVTASAPPWSSYDSGSDY